MQDLAQRHEYVAVYFTGPDCQAKKSCQKALAELETIDDDLAEIGVLMVTLEDLKTAEDNGSKKSHSFQTSPTFYLISGLEDLPAIGLFRNGHFLAYEGDVNNEKHILNWLKDEETLKIIGVIDEV